MGLSPAEVETGLVAIAGRADEVAAAMPAVYGALGLGVGEGALAIPRDYRVYGVAHLLESILALDAGVREVALPPADAPALALARELYAPSDLQSPIDVSLCMPLNTVRSRYGEASGRPALGDRSSPASPELTNWVMRTRASAASVAFCRT